MIKFCDSPAIRIAVHRLVKIVANVHHVTLAVANRARNNLRARRIILKRLPARQWLKARRKLLRRRVRIKPFSSLGRI
nr:MAG TPA: hypothetical protein [Caudoviricetes sp.]